MTRQDWQQLNIENTADSVAGRSTGKCVAAGVLLDLSTTRPASMTLVLFIISEVFGETHAHR